MGLENKESITSKLEKSFNRKELLENSIKILERMEQNFDNMNGNINDLYNQKLDFDDSNIFEKQALKLKNKINEIKNNMAFGEGFVNFAYSKISDKKIDSDSLYVMTNLLLSIQNRALTPRGELEWKKLNLLDLPNVNFDKKNNFIWVMINNIHNLKNKGLIGEYTKKLITLFSDQENWNLSEIDFFKKCEQAREILLMNEKFKHIVNPIILKINNYVGNGYSSYIDLEKNGQYTLKSLSFMDKKYRLLFLNELDTLKEKLIMKNFTEEELKKQFMKEAIELKRHHLRLYYSSMNGKEFHNRIKTNGGRMTKEMIRDLHIVFHGKSRNFNGQIIGPKNNTYSKIEIKNRIKKYQPIIDFVVEVVAKKQNIEDQEYVFKKHLEGLLIHESRLYAWAKSWSHCQGIAQLNSVLIKYKNGVIKNIHSINPYNPSEAILRSANYLAYLYGRFKSWTLALTAYNAGENALKKSIKAGNGIRVGDIGYAKKTKKEREEFWI